MERIFFTRNGNLNEINNILKRGGSIKMIHAVPNVVSSSPSRISTVSPTSMSLHYSHDEPEDSAEVYEGDVYAYIVVKMP